MPKRIKQPKRPKGISRLDHDLVVDVSTSKNSGTLPPSKEQVSMFMAEMGRKGGKIGGKRRLETMTSAQRKAAARRAAETRWKKP
jgi:hypothetical protein